LLSVLVALLFSCSDTPASGAKPDEPPQDGVTSDEPAVDESAFLWAPDSEICSLISPEVNLELCNKLKNYVYITSGSVPKTVTESDTPRTHEIVVGRSEREVSKRAYRLLDREMTDNADTSGYVLYGYNGSVAIAYSDGYVIDDAIDCFLSRFTDGTAEISNGVIEKRFASTLSFITKARETNREAAFKALERELDVGVVNELRRLYSTFYGDDTYMWLANLWDPVVGGFYYSNSARDNEGFLPDIETTVQALSFMSQSGLLEEYGGSYPKAISETMRASLLSFAISLQSPQDGFFYHPQWGTKISTSRRGRDLGWATELILTLGGQPLYDTPNGIDGSLGAPGAASVSLTGGLSLSRVQAVSRVIGTSTTPSYLKSPEAFRRFLDSLDFDNASYASGNTLNAIWREVKAAGEDYVELMVNYLYEKQNPENGLWEKTVSYEAVNGLFKLGSTITALGYKLQYTDAGMRSAMQMALTPELYPEFDVHVCSIYNMWQVMGFLIGSAEKHEGAARADYYRGMVLENAEELIRITAGKMEMFRRNDGGFSYLDGHSNAFSQGVTVALENTDESDVNATCLLSTGLIRGIFDVLGVKAVPLYYAEDGKYFLETVDSLGEIIKKDEMASYDGPTERVATFTDEFLDTYFLKSFYGKGDVQVSVDNYADDLNSGEKLISSFAVVKDPFNKDNNVLKVVSEKSKLHVHASTKAFVSNEAPAGSCYVFEARFCYTDILEAGDVTQLHLQKENGATVASFRMRVNPDMKTVGILCYNDGKEGQMNYEDIGLPIGEWFTLRLEFFATGAIDTQFARILVGTDGTEPIAVAEVIAYRENTLGSIPTAMNIAHQRTNGSTVYLDDISFSQINKEFKSELPPDPSEQFRPIPDTLADFENGFINSGNLVSYKDSNDGYKMIKYGVASHEGTEVCYSVTDDPTGAANKVLKVTTTNKKQNFAGYSELSVIGEARSLYVFDTKLYIENPKTSAHFASYYRFCDTDGNTVLDLRLHVANGAASLYAIKEVGTDSAGNLLASFSTECWIKLKIEFYKSNDGDFVKIYAARADKSYVLASATEAVSAKTSKPISAIRIYHQRMVATSVYYDDMLFSAVDKEYYPETDYPFEVSISDFEEGYINDGEMVSYDFNGTEYVKVEDTASSFDGSRVNYEVTNDPTGVDNKALKVVGEGTQSSTNAYSDIAVQTVAEGSCYVLESRLYVASQSALANIAFIYFRDSANNVAFYLNYIYDPSTNDCILRMVTKNSAGSDVYTTIGTFKPDKWVNMRLELYKSNVAEENCAKLYLGEDASDMKYVGGATACYNNEKYVTKNPVVRISCEYFRKNTFTAYFDDVSLTRVSKEYSAEQ